MTEKDKKIQDLKREIEKLKEEREFIFSYIEEKCVWDNHLVGYLFDLKAYDARKLMITLNQRKAFNNKKE